jgi:hypothetical protein
MMLFNRRSLHVMDSGKPAVSAASNGVAAPSESPVAIKRRQRPNYQRQLSKLLQRISFVLCFDVKTMNDKSY